MTKERIERLIELSVKEMDFGGIVDKEAELRELRAEFEGAVDIMQSERDRLRTALKTYGRHLSHCAGGAYPGPGPCTCGLAEALKGAE